MIIHLKGITKIFVIQGVRILIIIKPMPTFTL